MSCLSLDHEASLDRPQRVVTVEFETNDGTLWRGIGGGRSLDEAIAFARESASAGPYWRTIRAADLYGD